MKKDIRNVILSFGLVLSVTLGGVTVYAKKSEVDFGQDTAKTITTSEVAADLPQTTIPMASAAAATNTKSISKIIAKDGTTQTSVPTQTTDTKNEQYQLLQNQLAAAQLLQEEIDAQKAAELQAARDAARRASRRSRAS